MTEILITLGIGLVAGVLGGIFGVGGGVLIVPALVLILHASQHSATGTSLGALLPPVGLLGALEYYRHGEINLMWSLCLGLGLLIGAYFGAVIALNYISGLMLRRLFAIFLILVSVRMLFGK